MRKRREKNVEGSGGDYGGLEVITLEMATKKTRRMLSGGLVYHLCEKDVKVDGLLRLFVRVICEAIHL